MTQVATVEKLLQGGKAEIAVVRQSACGHDCADCAGCGVMGGHVIRTVARDRVGVAVGDKVLVYSDNRPVLGAAAAVYLLPVLFFFLGYAIAQQTALFAARVLITIGITAVGCVPAVFLDRKSRGVRFEITQRL